MFENIKNSYILSNIDDDFAVGSRRNLRYACGNIYACLMELNPKGLDPFKYLSFAKSDISSGDDRGGINGLGNAKKAIHLTIDCFLEIIGLAKAYKKLNFPAKLDIIDSLEAFPTNVIRDLNSKRNFIEHDYKTISIREAVNFVDIAEMFLRLCYPFLKHMVVGIHTSFKDGEKDIKCVLSHSECKIYIYENLKSRSFNSPIGIIYYNFSDDKRDKKLIKKIGINLSNSDEWLPYLSTFVYCTKKAIIPENPPYNTKEYERLMLFQSHRSYFF